MLRFLKTPLIVVSLLIPLTVPNSFAAMTITLTPSVPSPAPVGTIVTWTPTVTGAAPGTLWYRYRSRPVGADFRMVRDYGPETALDWTASDSEGTYEVELSVRNVNTGESESVIADFVMTSLVTGNSPVINPTSNPLVFLYSAPPCPANSQIRVRIETVNGSMWTPYKPCLAEKSANFYISGIPMSTSGTVRQEVQSPLRLDEGPAMSLLVPSATLPIPTFDVMQPPLPNAPNEILLQATLIKSTVATDMYGNVVWYYPGRISFLTRPQAGGTFFGLFQDFPEDVSHQIIREFDLVGTTLRETNAARISEQLAAMGVRSIDGFHHEVRELPDGRILLLADSEQLMTDVQGPGTVDVIGDVILVLDSDLQVLWAWDSFQHLDWHRTAILGETCTKSAGGCPPFYLAQTANDWLHGNSLQFAPDGNILYYTRHQDWLVKINYANGTGNGDIIWRLGKGGDFQTDSTDPNPWFSHQHDAQFEPNSTNTLTIFDNGNTRQAADPNAHSRGQVIVLDEKNLVAHFVLNADLGNFSAALGSAQRLPNGNYHFNLGWLPDVTSQSVEVDPLGDTVYTLHIGSPDYRSFRMRDLYTPYEIAGSPPGRRNNHRYSE